MNKLSQTAIEQDPLAAMAATEALERALARDPALRGIQVNDILRLVPGRRAIFSGQMGGQAVILRYLMHEDERAQARVEWPELLRADAAMPGPGLRVNRPVRLSDDAAIMVIARAEGTPLLTRMWDSPPPERAELMARAAQWLDAYTAPTTERRGIDRKRWVGMAERAAARQPHEALRPIEARILQKMKQLGRKLHRQPWRIAVTHGDFHPNNLIVDGDIVTGIDLGGPSKLPVYKDVARFLVHCARRDMLPSGARRFGVDRAGFDAFADAFAMDAVERDGFLPFMIAFETLFRVEHGDFPATRIRHTLAMSEALFDDLRQVSAPD